MSGLVESFCKGVKLSDVRPDLVNPEVELLKSNPTGINQYTNGGGTPAPNGLPQSLHDRLSAEGYSYAPESYSKGPKYLEPGTRLHEYVKNGGYTAMGGESVSLTTSPTNNLTAWEHTVDNGSAPRTAGVSVHGTGADEASLFTHLDADKSVSREGYNIIPRFPKGRGPRMLRPYHR